MIPQIPLKFCHFKAHCKKLSISSEYCGMPQAVDVKSHHTGKVVRFVPVQEGHPMWDEDGYDGEQMVYEPIVPVKNVSVLVIYNEF